MLKILLIYYEPIPAGQTMHVLSLARTLDNCKYRVTVVLPANLQRGIAAFKQAGVKVVPLPLRKVTWPPQSVINLARLIRQQDFDIVHIHSQEAGLLGRVVARMAGARSIIYTPQCIDIRQVKWHWLYVRLEHILAHVTDVLVSVNELDRERLIRWGIPPHKIVTIPNGIDLSHLLSLGDASQSAFEGPALSAPVLSHSLSLGDASQSEAEGVEGPAPSHSLSLGDASQSEAEGPVDVGGLRRALGLDEDRPLVMQVARLSAQKDPLAFVEGAVHVVRERPDTQFALVGEGPLREAVAKRVWALGLDGHVHLLGWQDKAFRLMAAADVVSLTSRWEGAPYTLLEAMAWSRPVVATAVNGCPEIVLDGGTGFLVPPGDRTAWARRVIDLLNDPVMAAAMGGQGRRRVEERFSLRDTVARIESLYQQVAEAQERPQLQGGPFPHITARTVLSSVFRTFQRK